MINNFIKFRELTVNILSEDVDQNYVNVLGSEVNRIKNSIRANIPEITLDISKLEESGCDISN